jgi:hypothetical protein
MLQGGQARPCGPRDRLHGPNGHRACCEKTLTKEILKFKARFLKIQIKV